MIINFVLHKYNQTETALKLQPTSPRLFRKKSSTNRINPIRCKKKWKARKIKCLEMKD